LPELAMLTGDHGARHLLKSAATVHADPYLVLDFDTSEDFD
jgi:CTP:molybdopterin cytidylyltransferase MocA